MSKASFPFGKRRLVFPYDPDKIARLLYKLVQDKGTPTNDERVWEGEEGLLVSVSYLYHDAEGPRHLIVVSEYGSVRMTLKAEPKGNSLTGTRVRRYLPGEWEQKMDKQLCGLS